jgi:TPR repeat protein
VTEDSSGAQPAAAELSPQERADVLRSARGVIAQEGTEAFTLSAVAREANLPRTSVYGSFRNKGELLVALAADDLAHTGRDMRGGKPADRPDPLPHAQLTASLIDKAGHPLRPYHPADTIVPEKAPEPAAVRKEEAIALKDEALVELLPSTARKRAEASQLTDIIDRLTLPADALGENSAQAFGRIDRRMSLLERALAELEDRFDKFAKGANDSIHASEASLEGLVARAERTDQRISDTATTLRGELLAAFTHIEIPKTEPPKLTLPPDEPAIAEAPQGDLRSQLKRQTANDDQRPPPSQDVPAAAASARPKRRRRPKHFFRRKELFGIGVISSAVIFATMGIALSEGFIDVQRGHFGPPPLREQTHAVSAPVRRAAVLPVIAVPKVVQIATAERPPAAPQPPAKLTPLGRIEALANGGNAKAAALLGIKYLDGDGLARNDADAAQWLERAAEAGEPVAQYRLGTLYQRGVGVVQDEAKALRWYEAAADQGNRKAMHNLGVFYAEGRGTTQDYDKAATWFRRAADMGYVDSQFDLAVLYERGAGVPQSLSDAYKWYAIAARNGDDVSKARIEVLETQLGTGALASAKAEVRAFRAQPMSRVANVTPRLADLTAK